MEQNVINEKVPLSCVLIYIMPFKELMKWHVLFTLLGGQQCPANRNYLCVCALYAKHNHNI